MMRKLFFILVIAFSIACNADTGKSSTSGSSSEDTDTSTLSGPQYLVRACAADVQNQFPEALIQFNSCFSGYRQSPSGETQDFLCGQFRVQDQGLWGEWISFATIKTSSYEQWQGAQASTFCQDGTIVWNSTDDISPDLQLALNSIRK
jgi:hypothetical protein